MKRRGRFLVLDGPDGAGKTTQVFRLARRLRREGRAVLVVREPGGTPLGRRLRRALLDSRLPMDPAVEALLFVAARAELLRRVVRPALERGEIVLSDRGSPSTFAYQGVAGGVGTRRVLALHGAFNSSPRPDVVLLLDLAPEAARARGRSNDRFERRDLKFAAAVRRGFRMWAARAGGRVAILDASAPAEKVEESVWKEVAPVLR